MYIKGKMLPNSEKNVGWDLYSHVLVFFFVYFLILMCRNILYIYMWFPNFKE